jgi:hypothetical protein
MCLDGELVLVSPLQSSGKAWLVVSVLSEQRDLELVNALSWQTHG